MSSTETLNTDLRPRKHTDMHPMPLHSLLSVLVALTFSGMYVSYIVKYIKQEAFLRNMAVHIDMMENRN